jgi:uncharacterized protein (TIGR02145 family)
MLSTVMKLKNRIWFYSLITSFILLFSCEEKKDIVYLNLNPWVDYGSMTDRDGNTYKTILIGTQTWMVKNLSTTSFKDGTSIPVVTDAASWENLLTPACCWQNNDPIRKVTYGVLYNWYAVNTGKLCPTGWHVPRDAEWTELIDYMGGENIAGGKLKESGFSHWSIPNAGATDEAHFKALPGGNRLNGPNSLFDDLGETGGWWTTENSEDFGLSRFIYYHIDHIQKALYPKKCGLSVRCIRDY